MTDATHTPSTAPLQAESAASSELSGLNARTARRQKLLLGSLGALALIGGSWFILGGDDKAKTGDPNAAQTIDTAARQDLTAARLLALNPDLLAAGAARRSNPETQAEGGPSAAAASDRNAAPRHVPLGKLPAKGAITWGPADGPRVVVFSDFHCGYCKKLEAELKAIGARVEERPISIFGAESRRDAERVLCSPRPELALHMAYSGLALANPKPCDTSGLDANEAFARAHGFGGTPVIVRPADGAVLEGFRPAAVLRDFLRAGPSLAPTPAPKG